MLRSLTLLLFFCSFYCHATPKTTPQKLPTNHPPVPNKLADDWYEIILNGVKVGYSYERIEEDGQNGLIQYFNLVRKIENGAPVEERIVSLSSIADLMPVSYTYLVKHANKSSSVEGTFDQKKGTMLISTSKKPIPAPGFKRKPTILFSGVFSQLLKRQGSLKPNMAYEAVYYLEDSHAFQKGTFRAVTSSEKKGTIQLLQQMGAITFDLWIDGEGKIQQTSSSDGSLQMKLSSVKAAKESWAEDKLFKD